MGSVLSTTSELLERLREPGNDPVWREFDGRYRPILVGVARRAGLSQEDAEDAAQEALTRFLTRFREGGYERGRGRLRAWMIGIVRNCIAEARRRQGARRAQRGYSVLDVLPEDGDLESAWDEECGRAMFERAMEELRTGTRLAEQTVRAFELLVVHGRSPEEVASEVGVSVDSVYAAKHRCARALRGIVDRLREAYEVE